MKQLIKFIYEMTKSIKRDGKVHKTIKKTMDIKDNIF